jgi:hypothetical protein
MKYIYVVHTDKSWDKTFNGPILDDLYLGVADIFSSYFKCKVSFVSNYVPVPVAFGYTISQYYLDISPEQETHIKLEDKIKEGMGELGDLLLAKVAGIGALYAYEVSARVRIAEFKDCINPFYQNEGLVVYSTQKPLGSGMYSSTRRRIGRSSEEAAVAKICSKFIEPDDQWYIVRIGVVADL